MRNRSKKYNYKIAMFRGDTPKPKKNEVVIIPNDNRLLDIAPYPAQGNLPSWWKDLPVKDMSLRRCNGTYDYLQYGFIIPMWTDVTVRPDASGVRFEYKLGSFGDDYAFHVDGFSTEMAKGCPFGENRKLDNLNYPKLVTPWRYFTPKGISLMALPVLHEPNPNYTVMPGMVNTDYYNQLHIVISVLTDKEFTIPAGTPMQHMIPIKRNENTKKLVFGNESMSRFHIGNGMSKEMGKGSISQQDNSQLYRRLRMEKDEEAESEKWYSLRK
jgi:hypothetical protein